MSPNSFYSLKIIGGNIYHKNGDSLHTTADVLHIGESPDCEIRYESFSNKGDSNFPIYYATILRDEDGDGWHLVKRSAHIHVAIAGEGDFGYVCQLKDGDVIRFGQHRMSLEFQEGHRTKQSFSGTVIEHKTPHLFFFYSLFTLLTIIVVGLALWLYHDEKFREITEDDICEMVSSVFLIKVDSVHWICSDKEMETVLCRKILYDEEEMFGTAFLTDDGKLITARHCIEYWLAKQFDLRTPVDSLEDIIRWAIFTEDYNTGRASESDTLWQLRVFCSLYSKDNLAEPVLHFTSTDDSVHINRFHDELIPLTDLSHRYVWRSVRSYFKNREMELGDIAILDVPIRGNISLANKDRLLSVNNKNRLAVCGFPITDATGVTKKSMVFSQAQLKQDSISPKCNFMFEGNIKNGYSGGPVFSRIDNRIVVIGVVSRADLKSKETFKWAVPISEVEQMQKRAAGNNTPRIQRKGVGL